MWVSIRPGHDQAARGIQLRRVGAQAPAAIAAILPSCNADIDDAKLAVLQDAGITNDQIHQFTAAGSAPR